jgi:hypothetical protein
VREGNHAGAEALDQLTAGVELEHRIERRHLARRICALVFTAALADPDRHAVLVDIDRARRAPLASLRELQRLFDRLVGVGEIVCGCDGVLREGDGAGEDCEYE